MLFILVGNLNALAPIVTMPFLITYAAVDYAYFKLAMSYDIKQQQKLLDQARREARHQAKETEHLPTTKLRDDDNFIKPSYGTGSGTGLGLGDSGNGATPERTEKDDSMEQENVDKDKHDEDATTSAKEKEATKVELGDAKQGGDNDGTLKPTNCEESDTALLIEKEKVEMDKPIHISTKERGMSYTYLLIQSILFA